MFGTSAFFDNSDSSVTVFLRMSQLVSLLMFSTFMTLRSHAPQPDLAHFQPDACGLVVGPSPLQVSQG